MNPKDPERLLSDPVRFLRGVGPRVASVLERLGVVSLRDLLYYLPLRYEDRSAVCRIADLKPGQPATVRARVVSSSLISVPYRRPRLTIFDVLASDDSGSLKLKWFNQRYLEKTIRQGADFVFHGEPKPIPKQGSPILKDMPLLEMTHPEYEATDEEDGESERVHSGRIVPFYRLTEGLTQKTLRRTIYGALHDTQLKLDDPIPPDILAGLGMPSLRECITKVHFPSDDQSLDSLNRGTCRYHQRLAFDELFMLQIGLAAMKRLKKLERGTSFQPAGGLVSGMLRRLPFRLTASQQRVFDEILRDMKSPHPMHRLLQGDVGSGKTVVSLMAMLIAVECGHQAAMMAPTEILAEQHFSTISRFVEHLGISVHLLTSTRKQTAFTAASGGGADIVVGTHALIQEGVAFRRLGLIVIDEQHRFGVLQRALLKRKGGNPDILVMTATPIPRTLALTLYGDLDYSIIDALPPGRTPVRTILVSEAQKQRIYDLIRTEVAEGKQAYVVYPVIEESEKTDLRDAVRGCELLRQRFPGMRVGLVHGRMKSPERDQVMRQFTGGSLDILVSTTVIEVGVDVPNATLMVIIHAERFGLAQLHQLRGRVGRGSKQSHCVLLYYKATEEALRRLNAVASSTDGFRIAEEDLSIRGPGEFFGTRQSGMPDLKAANLVRDVGLLDIARRKAFSLIDGDPTLSACPMLKTSLSEFWGKKLEIFKTA